MNIKHFLIILTVFCPLIRCKTNKTLEKTKVDEEFTGMLNDGDRFAFAFAKAVDCVLLQGRGNDSVNGLSNSTSTSSKVSFSCYFVIKLTLFFVTAALITASAVVVMVILKIYSYVRRFWNDRAVQH